MTFGVVAWLVNEVCIPEGTRLLFGWVAALFCRPTLSLALPGMMTSWVSGWWMECLFPGESCLAFGGVGGVGGVNGVGCIGGVGGVGDVGRFDSDKLSSTGMVEV